MADLLTKEEYKKELNNIKFKINKLKEELKELEILKKKYQVSYDNLVIEENNLSLKNDLYKLEDNDIFSLYLDKDTKITPLMDKYYYSKYSYLRLSSKLRYYDTFSNSVFYIALIVKKWIPRLNVINQI